MKKFGILFVVIAVLALAVTLTRGDRLANFDKNAERVGGHIVRKEERDLPGPPPRKEYWLTYTYRDKGGIQHTTSANFDDMELWKRLREGQAEIIYYNKKNPSESYLAVVLDRKKRK